MSCERDSKVHWVAVIALAAVLVACGASGETNFGAPTTPGTRSVRNGDAAAGSEPARDCQLGSTRPTPVSAAAGDQESEHDVTSFDGTKIRAHWFPLPQTSSGQPAPTVLMGPGWSMPGDTNADAIGVLGAINIRSLRDAGFNVLTWDPRGFGRSGGAAQVNDADHEGRDVQVLLDWVASRPEAELDVAGDPRVGMIGGSYGGGIQLVTAALDCRVDAIVPVIAWHSLVSSLYKGETVKAGWAGILTAVTKSRPVDPHVDEAYTSGTRAGALEPDDVDWFASRGPGDLVGRITAPTLIVQGTVDTLFTLDEAAANYSIIRGNGVPVAMYWFCGGHGVCLTDPGDQRHLQDVAIAWLRRYVMEDRSVDTGPRFDFLDQNGSRYTADDFPIPSTTPLNARGSGTLKLEPEGGSGPAKPPATEQMLTSLVLPVTPAPAENAVNVTMAMGSDPVVILGAPKLDLTYSGSSPAGEKPTRVFAQIVDEETGTLLGNQVTPVPVTLDGETHTVSVPLETVVFAAHPGARLRLQLVAATVTYATPRFGGSVTFEDISLALPVASGMAPKAR